MSIEGFFLERVVSYISVGSIRKIEQVVLKEVRFVIRGEHQLITIMIMILLHLDAEDLRLRHCQLHLELRHLVLEVGYGAHAAVHRISRPSIRLID